MDSEEVIRAWIQGLHQHPVYQHILEHGELFDQIARNERHRRHFRMDNKAQGQGCYANSQRFAQAYPGVKYYEGFRYGGVVVVDFAWNVVKGEVAEWTNFKGIDTVSPVYFGVEIPVEFLKENIGKKIELPAPEAPQISIPVRLDLGTPLLGWYLRQSS